jgi:hypothetical protein
MKVMVAGLQYGAWISFSPLRRGRPRRNEAGFGRIGAVQDRLPQSAGKGAQIGRGNEGVGKFNLFLAQVFQSVGAERISAQKDPVTSVRIINQQGRIELRHIGAANRGRLGCLLDVIQIKW